MRIFSFSVGHYSKSAIFRDFKRLSSKTLSFLRKNAKFWKFWEFSLFQSHSTANLILLENIKTMKTVFWKNPYFRSETPNFWIFWEILLFQWHSAENFRRLVISHIFKIFPEKSIEFFKKTQVVNVFRSFSLSVASYSKFVTFRDFEEIKTFSEKPIFFQKLCQILDLLRIFFISVAFNRNFDTFRNFKNIEDCFSKNPFF